MHFNQEFIFDFRGAGCAGFVKTKIRFIRFLNLVSPDCSKTAHSGKHITITALNMSHAYVFLAYSFQWACVRVT
jgi:hypothetical protein